MLQACLVRGLGRSSSKFSGWLYVSKWKHARPHRLKLMGNIKGRDSGRELAKTMLEK